MDHDIRKTSKYQIYKHPDLVRASLEVQGTNRKRPRSATTCITTLIETCADSWLHITGYNRVGLIARCFRGLCRLHAKASVISSKAATCNFAQCNKYYLAALYTRADAIVRHAGLLISASTRNGAPGFAVAAAVALNKRFCSPSTGGWLIKGSTNSRCPLYLPTYVPGVAAKSIAVVRDVGMIASRPVKSVTKSRRGSQRVRAIRFWPLRIMADVAY